MIDEIEPKDVAEKLAKNPKLLLIDVRRPEEFAEVHAEKAINIPLDQISGQILQEKGVKLDQEIYLICRSGARSMKACEILEAEGYLNLFNVSGGTMAWVDEKLPTEVMA